MSILLNQEQKNSLLSDLTASLSFRHPKFKEDISNIFKDDISLNEETTISLDAQTLYFDNNDLVMSIRSLPDSEVRVFIDLKIRGRLDRILSMTIKDYDPIMSGNSYKELYTQLTQGVL